MNWNLLISKENITFKSVDTWWSVLSIMHYTSMILTVLNLWTLYQHVDAIMFIILKKQIKRESDVYGQLTYRRTCLASIFIPSLNIFIVTACRCTAHIKNLTNINVPNYNSREARTPLNNIHKFNSIFQF